MVIEIKVDQALLDALTGIKEQLIQMNSVQGAPVEAKEKPMTLEEFTAPEYTLQEVRSKLATLESAKAKELINSFGAKKLTDLPKEKYAELMKKVGEL
ncbi:MAG: hypothetical protein J6F30_08575 [Cellulosilyticum sp.]|nr:hypothetical protein [Cellulosilyticum sp.]